MTRPAFLTTILAACICLGACGAKDPKGPKDPKVPAGAMHLSVLDRPISQRVGQGFIGFSFEYRAIEGYAGYDPTAINPVLVALMKAVAPGQAPELRIGGDSSDWTWWPVPGMVRPGGVSYSLDDRWLAVTKNLAQQAGLKLVLGLNLEANSLAVARAEARAFESGIGSAAISSIELGNEPELWNTFAWYHTRSGTPVFGRPAGYDLSSYINDFRAFAPTAPAQTPLAGPATGNVGWMQQLGQFVPAVPRLALVTVHRYPLANCFVPPTSIQFPTIPHLLSPAASLGLAATVAPAVAAAHAQQLPLRLGELNSVACRGAKGVSDTFASALWALDTLFAMAKVGADGINIHTFPGAKYGLFDFSHAGGRWVGFVHPEYYGLLAFAEAAPPGSKLITLRGVRGPMRAYATRGPDGTTRIALISFATRRTLTLAVRVPGSGATAQLERLRARSLQAKQGITFAGYSFGAVTSSGVLPRRSVSVPAIGNDYVVTLRPASAAVLTVPAS